MRLKKIMVFLFIVLVLGVLSSFSNVNLVKARVAVNSRVIHVPGNFATIQEAIVNATAGDTVLVSNGTYKEQVLINKPIKVIGQNRNDTIIDANGADYAVEITSSNVTLSGFTIQNATTPNWAGLWINGLSNTVSNVTIANCTVTKSLYAVWLSTTSNNIFRGNDFTNNTYDFGFTGEIPKYFVQDIDASNKVNGRPVYWLLKQNSLTISSDAGMVAAINCTDITVKDLILEHNGRSVLFVSTNNSIIQNVTISNSEMGIYLLHSSNSTVRSNMVSNSSQFGIILTNSNNNTVSNNKAFRCNWNIKLVTSNQNKIVANTISNSTDIDGDGLMLDRGCLYNLVSDNTIRFNIRAGIALDDQSKWNVFTRNLIEFNTGSTGGLELSDGSGSNLITENTFNQNSYGITITWSDKPTLSSESTVYKNNFLGNDVQVYNVSNLQYTYSGTWDNGAEGNYWSNFIGVDTNMNGISDSAYNIDANKVDHYPLMEPWSRNRTFAVNGTPFSVSMVSNSTIGGFAFNPTLPSPFIVFNVTGPAGAKGSCNVTIPKLLLSVNVSDAWVFVIDGNLMTPTPNFTDNGTHTIFYLVYDLSTHYIKIRGTNAYPEFPIQTILLLTLFFATLSVAVLRRKLH